MASSDFNVPSSSPKGAARGKKRKNEATQPQQASKKSKTTQNTTATSKGTGKLPSIGKHRAISVIPRESANGKGQSSRAKNPNKKATEQLQKKNGLLDLSSGEPVQHDTELVPATQHDDKSSKDHSSLKEGKPPQQLVASTTNGHNEVDEDSTDISSDEDDLQASSKKATPQKKVDHQKTQRQNGTLSTINKLEQNDRKSDVLVDDAALHDNLIVGFNKAGPRTKTHPTTLKNKPTAAIAPAVLTSSKKKPAQSEQVSTTKTATSSKKEDQHEASSNVAYPDEDALAAFIANPQAARNHPTPAHQTANRDTPGSTPGNPLEVLDNTDSEDGDDLNGHTQAYMEPTKSPRQPVIKLEPGRYEEQQLSENKKCKPASILKTKLKTKTTISDSIDAGSRSIKQVSGLEPPKPPHSNKDSGYGSTKLTIPATTKPPIARMQVNNTAPGLKRKISAAGSPLPIEKHNGVENRASHPAGSDDDVELLPSLRDMPTPDPKVLEAQFRLHKSETAKKQTKSTSGTLAVRAPDGCPNFDNILEWRSKLAPHQRYLFDQLAGDAKDIISYFVRQEGRLVELIEQFRNRGEHLVNAMGESHMQGAVQYRSDRERTKASQ